MQVDVEMQSTAETLHRVVRLPQQLVSRRALHRVAAAWLVVLWEVVCESVAGTMAALQAAKAPIEKGKNGN